MSSTTLDNISVMYPYSYKLGLELSRDTVKAVLIKPLQKSCMLISAMEIEVDDIYGSSDINTAASVNAVSEFIPDNSGGIPTVLVLPMDCVIEASVVIPKGTGINRDEWERWELSTHLSGSPDDYWYESVHVADSVCGKFHVRRIRAVRKSFVEKISEKAKELNLIIEEILFPQSIWADVLYNYGTKNNSKKSEYIYLDRKQAYLVRVSQGLVTDMLPARFPVNGNVRQFVEAIETLLSWHNGKSIPSAERILIDGGCPGEVASILTSKRRFTRFNLEPLSKVLHGTVEKPERFLMPLAALGVI